MAKFKYNARVSLTKCIRGPTNGHIVRYTCVDQLARIPAPLCSCCLPSLFPPRSTDFSACFMVSLAPSVIRQRRYTYRDMCDVCMCRMYSLQGCFKIHPTENARSSLPAFPPLGPSAIIRHVITVAHDCARPCTRDLTRRKYNSSRFYARIICGSTLLLARG